MPQNNEVHCSSYVEHHLLSFRTQTPTSRIATRNFAVRIFSTVFSALEIPMNMLSGVQYAT